VNYLIDIKRGTWNHDTILIDGHMSSFKEIFFICFRMKNNNFFQLSQKASVYSTHMGGVREMIDILN